MSDVNFIISPIGTITTVINGAVYKADPDHPNYVAIYNLLKETPSAEELLELIDIQTAVNNALETSEGDVILRDGVVYYDGEPVHNSISQRILDLLQDGFNVTPLVRFLDNLMQNPSKQSVEELYDFLGNTGLPITEDGHFLAYKGLRHDFKDKYSGTFDNSPGQVVSIRRNKVDDNRDRTCSNGLHVGAFEYAYDFAQGGPVVLCKVNPKDVVSVPLDCGAQKCRTCSYEVLEQYHNREELQRSLYKSDGAEAEGRVIPRGDTNLHTPAVSDMDALVDYYLENYSRAALVDIVREALMQDFMDECDGDYSSWEYDTEYDAVTDDLSDMGMVMLATKAAEIHCD